MIDVRADHFIGRRLLRLLGWTLLGGFLTYLVLQPEVLPSREVLARTWKWELAPAVMLATVTVLVSVALRGVRWVLLAAGHAPASAPILVAGFAWCTFLFQVLPFRGGDAVKVAWMKLHGGSIVRSTVAVVVERMLDAACLAFLVAGAVLLDSRISDAVGPYGRALLVALFAVAVAAFIAGGLAARNLYPWLAARACRGRILRAAAEAADAVKVLGEPARFLQCLLLSVLAWAALLGCYAVLLDATVGAPLAAALATVIMGALATFLGITPGSVGLFEAAGVVALAVYRVPPDTALAAVTLLHAVVFGAQALAGVAGRIYLSLRESELLRSR